MECLVLDPGFSPVARISWEKAITLLVKDRVKVVEHHDRIVRSVTVEMKVPAVVQFFREAKPRRKAVKFSRENVWARDQGRCQYCNTLLTRSEMTYDHVIPKEQGGKTCWENIVSCCEPCNQKKGGKTPHQAGMTLRRVPVRPKKLPNTMRFCLTYREGMPVQWKQWLQIDLPYWHGELDEEK